jgi:hypothetical protein
LVAAPRWLCLCRRQGNRNTKDVSNDLLLRVPYARGYTAKITFQKAA